MPNDLIGLDFKYDKNKLIVGGVIPYIKKKNF
jgi:hypothetical protein